MKTQSQRRNLVKTEAKTGGKQQNIVLRHYTVRTVTDNGLRIIIFKLLGSRFIEICP